VQDSDEIFDVVNEADEIVGRATRAEVHARKLRHRALHVFVFDANGRLFLQERSHNKDSFPGRLDSSASGHVHSGESYEAGAVRELSEELGLEILAEDLKRHFKIEACSETDWEFVWTYSLQTRAPLRLHPLEIESGAFYLPGQIRAMLAQPPDKFAPSFRRVFQEFDRRKLWPRSGRH